MTTPIVGFTASAFAPYHFGHARFLAEARANCDRLIVALHDDPSVERPWKIRPVQTADQRAEMLLSIRYVDEVQVYSTEADLVELLEELRPDVRFMGSDYIGQPFTGDHLGIRVHYHVRNHGFSSGQYRRGLAASIEAAGPKPEGEV